VQISRHDVGIKFFPPSGFMLLMPNPAMRNRVLACNGGLTIGRAKLQLLPWTCKVGAEAAKLSPSKFVPSSKVFPAMHDRRLSFNVCFHTGCDPRGHAAPQPLLGR
jgi:hypothetical protein